MKHTVMARDTRNGWQVIVSSSVMMSFALLGDALIYAILPIYSESFGITMPMVGVLLSANRLVRVFAYGLISDLVSAHGKRLLCIIAAIMATASTGLYGISTGFFPLLIARIIWGVAYAILVLSTLAYAVEYKEKAGTRVGVSQAIQRLGPITALLLGAWLVGLVGPNIVFLLMAVPTTLGIFIALSLPKQEPIAQLPNRNQLKWAKPTPLDILYFLQGYAVDGLFAISVILMLAESTNLSTAVLGGGALLALRHLGEATGAPLFGMIADRFGAGKIFFIAAIFTTMGLLLISLSYVVIGAVVLMIFRGALASLGPAIIAQTSLGQQDLMSNLARMQTWRDLGAAIGPLVTGTTLIYLSAELQHAIAAIIFGAVLIYFSKSKIFILTKK